MYLSVRAHLCKLPRKGTKKNRNIQTKNQFVCEKRQFANSSAIAACLPANGRVCQRASVPAVSINTPARTHIYIFRKLLARWHTGTLLTFYSLSTHSPMPTQNSPIIKISLSSIPSGVFRGSIAGLPRVVSKPNLPKKCTIVKISLFLSSHKNGCPPHSRTLQKNRDCHFGSLYPYISATLRRITS